VIMAVFPVAAVVPLTAVGLASRRAFDVHRAGLQWVGEIGRQVMGCSLLLIGGLVLLGLDKRLESWLLDLTPEWLLALTTRF
jgi:cytochrome c-type biogenesis protein